ncbi:MAG: phage holin family protein [Pseudomonadota bacterium]
MANGKAQSAGHLVIDMLNNVTALARSEVDMARAEVNENVKRAALAIGFLVAAVVFALSALNVLSAAIVAGLAEAGLEPGWAAFIVGGIFAVLAFALMQKGMNDLKLSSLAPTRAAENVKRDTQTVKERINA